MKYISLIIQVTVISQSHFELEMHQFFRVHVKDVVFKTFSPYGFIGAYATAFDGAVQ